MRRFEVTAIGDMNAVERTAGCDVMEGLELAEFTACVRSFEKVSVEETLTIRRKPSVGDLR